jgi:hypothetical protein
MGGLRLITCAFLSAKVPFFVFNLFERKPFLIDKLKTQIVLVLGEYEEVNHVSIKEAAPP